MMTEIYVTIIVCLMHGSAGLCLIMKNGVFGILAHKQWMCDTGSMKQSLH